MSELVVNAEPSPEALAYVFGQPVLEAPKDLFIPPDALQIVLERFEGPLDLLLYLIRKQNLNVLAIPMALITKQYLNYIKTLNENRLDLAAEYLLMAALLIEIKSRLLLPKPPTELEEEVEDPRAELARRLLAYEQMKLAAMDLDQLPLAGRDFAWVCVHFEQEVEPVLPKVNIGDLKQVWLRILSRAKNNQNHQVHKEALSVREQMSAILKFLSEKGQCLFEELFADKSSIPFLVVNFVAVLELVKEGLVDIQQSGNFMPITVSSLKIYQ